MDALDQLALMLASALRSCPTDVALLEHPSQPPRVTLRQRLSGGSRTRRSRRQGVTRALRKAALDPLGQRR